MADGNRWTYLQQRYMSNAEEEKRSDTAERPKTKRKKKKKKDKDEGGKDRNADGRPGIVLVDEDEERNANEPKDQEPSKVEGRGSEQQDARGIWVEVNTLRTIHDERGRKQEEHTRASRPKTPSFQHHNSWEIPNHLNYAGPNSSPDLGPPRRNRHDSSPDLSPPRRNRHDSPPDLSPPRRNRHNSPPDLSPPRRNRHDSPPDLSPPRRNRHDSPPDLSPPRRNRQEMLQEQGTAGVQTSPLRQDLEEHDMEAKEADGTESKAATGLIAGRDLSREIRRKAEGEDGAFQAMDPEATGRGADTIYRDKQGMKLKVSEVADASSDARKRKVPEWGAGLVQKRMREEQIQRLQEARAGPFAQYTSTQDYDAKLRSRSRWGDPLASQKDYYENIMENLGHPLQTSECMSIPPDIPAHSWLKRKLPPPPNRYDILPGRHWDGVNRSNGFEAAYFDHMAKQATRNKQAREWSTADM